MRTAIERYFQSAKCSRLLNQRQYRGIAKVSLHARMLHLAYLSTALAHLKADDYIGMRRMPVKLPSVQRAKGKLPPAAIDGDGLTMP